MGDYEEVIKRGLRYVVVGSINTILSYCVYAVGLVFHIVYPIALGISYLFGISVSFVWNKGWTFKGREKPRWQEMKFVSVYLISYFINLCILYAAIHLLLLSPMIGELLAIVISTGSSFLGHYFISFPKQTNLDEGY